MALRDYAWKLGRVSYAKRGLGDALVLIHNIYPGASREEFSRNIDELARQHTVYALDLLGFGASDAPRLKYTATTYTSLIGDFLRDVPGEPAHVVSAGLSCAYVSDVAVWRPELFRKLVMICPRSEPTGLDIPRWLAPFRRFILCNPPVGPGYYDTMTCDYELRQFLLTCFHDPKNVTADRVERIHDNAALPGSIYPYASLLTGYLDASLLKSLPHVARETLLLWGRQAKPTPVEHSVRLAALSQRGRLEVIENAGAWVHDEQSRAVNRIICEFLDAEEVQTPRKPLAVTA